jgi:hypothetical protein
MQACNSIMHDAYDNNTLAWCHVPYHVCYTATNLQLQQQQQQCTTVDAYGNTVVTFGSKTGVQADEYGAGPAAYWYLKLNIKTEHKN